MSDIDCYISRSKARDGERKRGSHGQELQAFALEANANTRFSQSSYHQRRYVIPKMQASTSATSSALFAAINFEVAALVAWAVNLSDV